MWHLYQTIQIPCHYPRLKTCSQSNNMCNTRYLIQRPSKVQIKSSTITIEQISKSPGCRSGVQWNIPADLVFNGSHQDASSLTNMRLSNSGQTFQISNICLTPWHCIRKHNENAIINSYYSITELKAKNEREYTSCLSMQYPWYNNLWDTLLPRRPWRHGDTHVSIQKYSDSLKSVRLNMHSSGAMAVP